MRSRIYRSLVVVATFSAGAAGAQPAGGPPMGGGGGARGPAAASPAPAAPMAEEEDTGSETEGLEVQDTPTTGKKPQAGRETAPGEVHTVVKGDTLWDLSQKFLGSPWYWPKVWSYNPEIANPHWIYPGNLVRFFPNGEEAPTKVEAGGSADGAAAAENGGEEGVDEAEAIAEAFEEDRVYVAGKIGYTPKATRKVSQVGFVTPKELEESGRIDSSFSEAEMLSYPDTVYVSFKQKAGARVGDRYLLYRTESEIKRPGSGERFGYLTKLLGVVKVTKVSDRLVTAAIQETWDEVVRGDLVGPFGEQIIRSIGDRPNEKDLQGQIVSAIIPHMTIMGEYHLVVVDKGSSDGVMQGNTFNVVRQSDLGGSFLKPEVADERMPIEDVAQCMAVDVKEKSTVCLVIRSIREIVPGDRVQMRRAGSSEPRASR